MGIFSRTPCDKLLMAEIFERYFCSSPALSPSGGCRRSVRLQRFVFVSICSSCSSCMALMRPCMNASSALIQLPLLALFSRCGYLSLCRCTPHRRLAPLSFWVTSQSGENQATDWLIDSCKLISYDVMML